MFRTILFALLLALISLGSAQANEPQQQPQPRRGTATGLIPDYFGSDISVEIDFWNVGALNGDPALADATVVTECVNVNIHNEDGVVCEGVSLAGTFSGGPDGVITFETLTLQLRGGKYFEFVIPGVATHKIEVDNPEIFDPWLKKVDTRVRFSDLWGQVEISCPPDVEGSWDVAKLGMVIYAECHIKTGEDSGVILSFPDMTTFTLKPESEIVVPAPEGPESTLSLLAGDIWANVKSMVKNGTMKVRMSQAVAGIKGTTFVLTETGTKSTISVIEGEVDFESTATGKSVSVGEGESVSATSAGLSEKTLFDVEAEMAEWSEERTVIDDPNAVNEDEDEGDVEEESTAKPKKTPADTGSAAEGEGSSREESVDDSGGGNTALLVFGGIVVGAFIVGAVFLARRRKPAG